MDVQFPREVQAIINTIEGRGFSIAPYEEGGVVCGAEMEGWTDGGVDMLHFIDLRGKDINDPEAWKEEIASIAADFDIDEEIRVHRESDRYCSAFTCRASVEDFEGWQESLRRLAQAVLYPEIKQEDSAVSAHGGPETITLEEVAKEYLNICDNDCCGDDTVGIPCCPFYCFPDVVEGHCVPGICKLKRCIGEEG